MGGPESNHRYVTDILHRITGTSLCVFVSVANNDLSILKRRPSDLKRYIIWTMHIKSTHGSMTNYVCKERLHWTPLPSSDDDDEPTFPCGDPRPFRSSDDYKILRNDWPYGISRDITHLVVWLKTRLPTVPPEGYLTPESSRLVEEFVQKTFTGRLSSAGYGHDRVQWFKNWTQLQSVRGLDHFHVLLKDVPSELLCEWTSDVA